MSSILDNVQRYLVDYLTPRLLPREDGNLVKVSDIRAAEAELQKRVAELSDMLDHQRDEAIATERRLLARIAELEQAASVAVPVEDNVPPQGFVDYVARNYCGEVVFSDPVWHAKKLWTAAQYFGKPAPQPAVAEPCAEKLGERCIDGGKCHHACTGKCFRRECCEPFSDYTGPWKYEAETSATASVAGLQKGGSHD